MCSDEVWSATACSAKSKSSWFRTIRYVSIENRLLLPERRHRVCVPVVRHTFRFRCCGNQYEYWQNNYWLICTHTHTHIYIDTRTTGGTRWTLGLQLASPKTTLTNQRITPPCTRIQYARGTCSDDDGLLGWRRKQKSRKIESYTMISARRPGSRIIITAVIITIILLFIDKRRRSRQ